VPLSLELADSLRRHRATARFAGDDDPVFASIRGNPPNHANVARRYLKPAAEEVGAEWAGFHTLRHTCASLLFDGGANIVQVQRSLGHHSPSFTLDTYVHLLPGEGAEPLEIDPEVGWDGNRVATARAGLTRTHPDTANAEIAI
jgi:integrase